MCDAESQVFAPQQEVLPVDSQPLEETLVESLPVDSQPLGDSVRLSQPIGDSLRLSQPLEETPTVLSALPTTPPTFMQDWNRMHVPVLMPQAHGQDDFVKIVMSSLELGHKVSLDLEAPPAVGNSIVQASMTIHSTPPRFTLVSLDVTDIEFIAQDNSVFGLSPRVRSRSPKRPIPFNRQKSTETISSSPGTATDTVPNNPTNEA